MYSSCKICSSVTTLKCAECDTPFCSKECQSIDHIGARGKQSGRSSRKGLGTTKKKPTTTIPQYNIVKIKPETKYSIKQISNHVVFHPSTEMAPIYNKQYFERYDKIPKKNGKKIGITHLIHGAEPLTGPLPNNHIIYIMRRNDTERKNKYSIDVSKQGPYSNALPNITILKTNRKDYCGKNSSWCSDLSLEKVEKKDKDFHPDYILIWQTIIEYEIDKKYIVDDELWFKQLSLTFKLYDEVIANDKLIVLGCALCVNRSPHTLILYFMYHGISIDDAYEEVKKLAGQKELFGWPKDQEDIKNKLNNIKEKYFFY